MTRLLDVVLSAIGLVVTSPLMLLGAVGTKLSSRGAVLFRAERAGLHGEPFTMYKLRTMHVGASSSGRITGGVDGRVFTWGRLLRRFKLDELPQLVNVVKGDMSLVGPRPEDITIVREHYTPFMVASLAVRPGITGPGSLDYFADEESLPDDPVAAERHYLDNLLPRKIALDLVYVEHRSTTYYLSLVVRTLCGVVGLERPWAGRAAWEQAEAERLLVREGASSR